MGRKIVLLSDGTGNSAAKVWRSNVWRTFECIDLSGNEQVACYDDGVGTGRFRPFALVGSAFGFGLQRNVLDLYKFACRNYRSEDDEIFGFGFSRGAFTIRIVIDLILDQGLVQGRDDAELEAQAKAAYRTYRAKYFSTYWPWHPVRGGIDAFKFVFGTHYDEFRNRRDVRVRFLGLWDTVAAYGTPIDGLTRGISYWIYPWILPNQKLNDRVERGCHALSIDEDRESFLPVLWDETDEPATRRGVNDRQYLAGDRISQVWFAGAHSNVGGGYPDDSLAHISLTWILSEAKRAGLRLKRGLDAAPQSLRHIARSADKDGRLYRPRSGLGGYYRYGPRDLRRLGDDWLKRKDGGAAQPTIRIHESVLARIKNHAHDYAPLGLPPYYDVVKPSGEIVPLADSGYETPPQADARWNAQRGLWFNIACQRALHLLTVLLTIWLVLSPMAQPPQSSTGDVFGWLPDAIRTAGGMFPGMVERWFEGAAQHYRSLLPTVALLLLAQLVNRRLAASATRQAAMAWKLSLADRTIASPESRFRTWACASYEALMTFRRGTRVYFEPAIAAIIFMLCALLIANKLAFNVQDYAGWTCPAGTAGAMTDKAGVRLPKPLTAGELLLADGVTRPYEEFKARSHAAWSKKYDEAHPLAANATEPDKATWAKAKEKALKNELRTKFDIVKHHPQGRNLPSFSTDRLCQSLGVTVEKDKKYLIQIEHPLSFMDSDIPAHLGFSASDVGPLWRRILFTVATPIKRDVRQKWFQLTLRYGRVGAVEDQMLADHSQPERQETFYQDCIRAKADGELFIYVNNAVIGIPGLYDVFYRNNQGQSRVYVQQVVRCPQD